VDAFNFSLLGNAMKFKIGDMVKLNPKIEQLLVEKAGFAEEDLIIFRDGWKEFYNKPSKILSVQSYVDDDIVYGLMIKSHSMNFFNEWALSPVSPQIEFNFT
jgi:23S rRNA-/tRNA-specific pseudouridylate synthase